MAEIRKIKERPVLDYMARDYDSLLESMYTRIPELMPEWKNFRNQADFGNVMLQLFAHMGDILSYYQDRIANESFLATAQSRSSVIRHLQLIGYRLATAAPASATLRVTVSRDCKNLITINKGDAFATRAIDGAPPVRFEYTADMPLLIDCGGPGMIPFTDEDGKEMKYFDGVPVEEGWLIKNERIGASDGTTDQRFTLGHRQLIMRSRGEGKRSSEDIIIIGDYSGIKSKWVQQEYLLFCDSEQKAFSIDIDEEDRATVLFGDGAYGAIPPEETVLFATYRTGGGVRGNVPEGAITTILNAPGLKNANAKITNRECGVGGAQRESIEHAVKHAPSVFRSNKRAVTAEDYKELALNFRGVGKVRAEAAGWNSVNLFIAPQGGGYVNDVLEANLLAYFEDKRPISTRIRICDVTYIPIFVTAVISVESYYLENEIVEKVRLAGKELLSFDNVDFGQILYISKFYEAIENIEGVAYVTINEFVAERNMVQKSYLDKGRIELAPSELPSIPSSPEYAYGINVKLESEG